MSVNIEKIYIYLNGNRQKNPKWVDPMGKIWPNLTTEDNINEAPLT